MRWEALFSDLQGQWEAEQRAEDDARIADLAELEMGRMVLADRLRAKAGAPVTVRLLDGSEVAGIVVDAAPHWLLVGSGERRTLMPVAAVAMAWPLGAAAAKAGVVETRLGITHVLRAIAREGVTVRIRCLAGEVRGRIVRVGADHLDIAAAGAWAEAGGPGRVPAMTLSIPGLLLVESA